MDITVDSLLIQIFYRFIYIRNVDPVHTAVGHVYVQITRGHLGVLVNFHLGNLSILHGGLHILIGIGFRMQKAAA